MEFRDLMAPDTEPTDQELAAVMRQARDLAAQRRALAEASLTERLAEAVRSARERLLRGEGHRS